MLETVGCCASQHRQMETLNKIKIWLFLKFGFDGVFMGKHPTPTHQSTPQTPLYPSLSHIKPRFNFFKLSDIKPFNISHIL